MISIPPRCLAALRRRYAEPHRAYHNQAHIDAMLLGLDAEGPRVTHRATVELAIWYHDAIYDPAATDNEANSAALLLADMQSVAPVAVVRAAAAMILATASHRIPAKMQAASRHDLAMFLDLDMAVLGGTPAAYDLYEAGIAAEFIPVHGAAVFRTGRAAFLSSLLGRDRLFHTDHVHQRLDAAARANLARALKALSGIQTP